MRVAALDAALACAVRCGMHWGPGRALSHACMRVWAAAAAHLGRSPAWLQSREFYQHPHALPGADVTDVRRIDQQLLHQSHAGRHVPAGQECMRHGSPVSGLYSQIMHHDIDSPLVLCIALC